MSSERDGSQPVMMLPVTGGSGWESMIDRKTLSGSWKLALHLSARTLAGNQLEIDLEPVVIDKGYLVDAMMASMSVPGALPPYEIDGRWLVDGGVTNNMPVDVARQMGADIVIAVDISTDYKSQEAFTNFLTVADQLSNYLVRRSTELQAETLTDDDVLAASSGRPDGNHRIR